MALLKVICWAIIFITRLRFPPGKSLASYIISNCMKCDHSNFYDKCKYF